LLKTIAAKKAGPYEKKDLESASMADNNRGWLCNCPLGDIAAENKC
jgi:hypothetical protein